MRWRLKKNYNVHGLVDQLPLSERHKGEYDIPICTQYGDDQEDNFFAELSSEQDDNPDEEEGEFDLEPLPAKIKCFQDAISSLEDVETFLDSKGQP